MSEPDLEFVANGDMDEDELRRVMQEALDSVNEGMADTLKAFGMEPFTLEVLFDE